MKSLGDVFASRDTSEELYVSDQKKRYRRAKKGLYSRQKSVFDFIHLIKSWEKIVGKMMAENTIPLKIHQNTLLISAKHPVFAQELSFLIPKILEKIHDHFPELTQNLTHIKFAHSKYTASQFTKRNENSSFHQQNKVKREKIHPFSPQFQKIKIQSEELFQDITDDEIKEILINYKLS